MEQSILNNHYQPQHKVLLETGVVGRDRTAVNCGNGKLRQWLILAFFCGRCRRRKKMFFFRERPFGADRPFAAERKFAAELIFVP